MIEHYTYRLNVLSRETTVWLGEDGFQVFEKDGVPAHYAYDRIAKVRLSYEPSRATADIYLCRLYLSGRSAPVVTASSTFYRGFLTFDPQLDAYRRFVQNIHAKLASRHGVVYRGGVSALAYWGNAAFLTVVVVFSAMLLIPIAAEVTLSGMVWLKIALLAFLAPLAAMWFWANRPRAYDPGAIPTELLPPSGEGKTIDGERPH